jgi:CBS domain-containing protein
MRGNGCEPEGFRRIVMNVVNCMSKAPIWCSPDQDVTTLAKLMAENNIGFIPIVSDADEHKLVGVVTDRDVCLQVVAKGYDPRFKKIGEIMSRDLLLARTTDSVVLALLMMQTGQVRRLPVIDLEGKLAGIISLDDLICSQAIGSVAMMKAIPRILVAAKRGPSLSMRKAS